MNSLKATSQDAQSGRALFPPVWFSRFPLCLCLLLLLPAMLHAQSLTLSSDTQISTAGYFQLSWHLTSAPADVRYHLLERQANDAFKTIYEGADLASVISGKANGIYEYQVMAEAGSTAPVVSNIVSVEVAHHSLTYALIMFAMGLIIFLSILIVILRNVRAE